ncbi:hypothetical protein SVIOM74S_09694 [Streptomyces violarus]
MQRAFLAVLGAQAFTVRSAPSTRSSAAPMTPTACWACLLALLMRGAIVPITAPAPAITATVTPSSTGSTSPIITIVATRVRPPVPRPTSDSVVTVRSRVVSEVIRAIRSPGSVRSTAVMRSRSRYDDSERRAPSTTDSAVRRSTYEPSAPTAALVTTRADIASSAPVIARSCARSSIRPRATSGSISPVAPVTSESTAPASRDRRCGRTYPRSSRQAGVPVWVSAMLTSLLRRRAERSGYGAAGALPGVFGQRVSW